MTLVDLHDPDAPLLQGFAPELVDEAYEAAFRYARRAARRMLQRPHDQQDTVRLFAADLSGFHDEVVVAIGNELAAITTHVVDHFDHVRTITPLPEICQAWTRSAADAERLAHRLTVWLGRVWWWSDRAAPTDGLCRRGRDLLRSTVIGLMATTAMLQSLPNPERGVRDYEDSCAAFG